MILLTAATNPPRTRPLLLIVEDHEDTRQMYAEFLSMEYDVIEAGNGHEALAAIRSRQPDVVITDLALPGMDGLQVMEETRRESSLDGVAFICLSGYGGSAHEERARAAGADLVLLKPCLPEALMQEVGALLGGRRTKDS
jgi:two-component system cell cycle response regulator DivK